MIVSTINHQAKPTRRRFTIIREEVWETEELNSGKVEIHGPFKGEIRDVDETATKSAVNFSRQPTLASVAAWLHNLPGGLNEELCGCCGGPFEDVPATNNSVGTTVSNVQKN